MEIRKWHTFAPRHLLLLVLLLLLRHSRDFCRRQNRNNPRNTRRARNLLSALEQQQSASVSLPAEMTQHSSPPTSRSSNFPPENCPKHCERSAFRRLSRLGTHFLRPRRAPSLALALTVGGHRGESRAWLAGWLGNSTALGQSRAQNTHSSLGTGCGRDALSSCGATTAYNKKHSPRVKQPTTSQARLLTNAPRPVPERQYYCADFGRGRTRRRTRGSQGICACPG